MFATAEQLADKQDKCNEAVHEMNLCIRVCILSQLFLMILTKQEYLESSAHVDTAAKLLQSYSSNVEYNLKAVDKMPKPV